jgi:signal transduction histidine kinase
MAAACLYALDCRFFSLLFFTDNKYKTPPPYGKDGMIALAEENLSGSRPLFLIDGWLLTDERVERLPTYIGEFSNLQRGDKKVSPHGRAVYQMILRYDGKPMEVAMSFPSLFSSHTITLDQKVLSHGKGSAQFSFTITEGDHLLTVETKSKAGYYSGMYHPPALGNTKTIFHMAFLQCIVYSIACFAVLALIIFTWALWRQSKDRLALWFGALCCCYSLYLSYYFVRLLSLPLERYWYLIQSVALYGLCYCVLQLATLSGGLEKQGYTTWLRRILTIASASLLLMAILIPVFPWAVWLHGILTNCYYIFTFCATLLLVLRSGRHLSGEQQFTRLACIAFGTGLLYNLFASNLFEPILLFWQFEWCGLFFILLFGAMMASRNKRILAENEAFHVHLEELVEKRTEELKNLLQERKAFFADMAHDLKAPVYAAGSFIQAIRTHNTGVDTELLRYIDLVEQKQQEMARRIQGLTVYNKMDELSEPYEKISVKGLLEEVYHAHHMAAEVQSVYLIAELPEVEGYLYAQPKKLEILFENLIVNALKFTPGGGKITLSSTADEEGCHLSVADTGCGISPEDVPHLFERFYIGKESSGSGSGLGLYIAKSIVEELHGEIYVSSKIGQGSVFFIDLPLIRK